jgi:capsular polysaccharide biosynthesis protein/MinD-like ATPase involved in chromosome partitioning or flagellar assembly
VELGGYFSVARRWWTTLLIATAVAGLAGYAIASSVPPTYEGTARLLVGPLVGNVDVTRAAGAISFTYAELAVSEPALAEVRQQLGLPADTPIVARAIPNETTRFLQIRAEYGDPEVAASISNLLANNLIAIERPGVELPEGQLELVEPAIANPEPIAPQVSLIAIVAAATGLLAAIVLVLLVEYLGNTINSRAELASTAAVPILGSASLGRRFRPSRRQPTIVDAQPESKAATAVRFIATKIAYASADGPASSALIIGMAKRDGAADLALGVATALARAGRTAVVVDANDESDELSALVGAEGAGLSDLLSHPEMDPMDVALSRPHWPAVISRGDLAPSTLVDPDAARTLIGKLHQQFEIVIVVSAPVHLSGNALPWAKAVDHVVLAVERDRARRDDLAYAMENLAGVNATVLGTVLLDHAPRPKRESRPAPAPRRASEQPYAVAASRASSNEPRRTTRRGG